MAAAISRMENASLTGVSRSGWIRTRQQERSFNKALWTSTVKNERNRVMDEWTETFGTELPTQYLVDNDLMEIIPGSPYICPVDSSISILSVPSAAPL